jgi:hypothetical protein
VSTVSWLEVLAVIGIVGFVGLNRVGQAAVIMPRAMRAGIPFAPEKDGRTFLGDAFGGHDHDASGRY